MKKEPSDHTKLELVRKGRDPGNVTEYENNVKVVCDSYGTRTDRDFHINIEPCVDEEKDLGDHENVTEYEHQVKVEPPDPCDTWTETHSQIKIEPGGEIDNDSTDLTDTILEDGVKLEPCDDGNIRTFCYDNFGTVQIKFESVVHTECFQNVYSPNCDMTESVENVPVKSDEDYIPEEMVHVSSIKMEPRESEFVEEGFKTEPVTACDLNIKYEIGPSDSTAFMNACGDRSVTASATDTMSDAVYIKQEQEEEINKDVELFVEQSNCLARCIGQLPIQINDPLHVTVSISSKEVYQFGKNQHLLKIDFSACIAVIAKQDLHLNSTFRN
jgi:hypothetical protein